MALQERIVTIPHYGPLRLRVWVKPGFCGCPVSIILEIARFTGRNLGRPPANCAFDVIRVILTRNQHRCRNHPIHLRPIPLLQSMGGLLLICVQRGEKAPRRPVWRLPHRNMGRQTSFSLSTGCLLIQETLGLLQELTRLGPARSIAATPQTGADPARDAPTVDA